LPFFFDVVAYGGVESEELKRHIDTKGKVLFDRGMSEWREVRLGDVADVIGGGTPKTSVEEYWNGSIPWLAPRDLTGYSKVYISHGDRFITECSLMVIASDQSAFSPLMAISTSEASL
jgi:hypothetical protein